MRISTDFESGRVAVASADDGHATVEIVADGAAPSFKQWFCFRVHGAEGIDLTIEITNAGQCSYAGGFEGYAACASYDGERWFRVPTEYDGEVMTIAHTPGADSITYAYYAPWLESRLDDLAESLASHPRAMVSELGQSVEGRPIRCISFASAAENPMRIWVIAQQHPGESMAGWFAEGLIARLAGDEELAERILSRAEVHVVPRMNPDGAALGNHRTNAAGVDLNRAWLEPSASESPEVLAVREAMIARGGVDMFIDVHGEEQVPYVFVAGAEGNPHYTDRIEALEDRFSELMLEASSAFQVEEGYPKDLPGDGELRCAANFVGELFDCLSLTLEMPFSDDANDPDGEVGWSPERSAKLGSDVLETIAAMIDDLR